MGKQIYQKHPLDFVTPEILYQMGGRLPRAKEGIPPEAPIAVPATTATAPVMLPEFGHNYQEQRRLQLEYEAAQRKKKYDKDQGTYVSPQQAQRKQILTQVGEAMKALGTDPTDPEAVGTELAANILLPVIGEKISPYAKKAASWFKKLDNYSFNPITNLQYVAENPEAIKAGLKGLMKPKPPIATPAQKKLLDNVRLAGKHINAYKFHGAEPEDKFEALKALTKLDIPDQALVNATGKTKAEFRAEMDSLGEIIAGKKQRPAAPIGPDPENVAPMSMTDLMQQEGSTARQRALEREIGNLEANLNDPDLANTLTFDELGQMQDNLDALYTEMDQIRNPIQPPIDPVSGVSLDPRQQLEQEIAQYENLLSHPEANSRFSAGDMEDMQNTLNDLHADLDDMLNPRAHPSVPADSDIDAGYNNIRLSDDQLALDQALANTRAAQGLPAAPTTTAEAFQAASTYQPTTINPIDLSHLVRPTQRPPAVSNLAEFPPHITPSHSYGFGDDLVNKHYPGYESLVDYASNSIPKQAERELKAGLKRFMASPKGTSVIPSSSLSTDSYTTVMDKVPGYMKKGVLEPKFLDWQAFNSMGHLTKSGIDNENLLKYINAHVKEINKELPRAKKIPYGKIENGVVLYPQIGLIRKLFGGALDRFMSGGPTPAKAHEMLKDGTAHGKPLTAKQKRYFGMIYGNSKKPEGGAVEVSDPNDPRLKAYNDSLTLYKANPAIAQMQLKLAEAYRKAVKSGQVRQDPSGLLIGQGGDAVDAFGKVVEEQGRLLDSYGINGHHYKSNIYPSVPNPKYRMHWDDMESPLAADQMMELMFKKPVQPYMLGKPIEKIKVPEAKVKEVIPQRTLAPNKTVLPKFQSYTASQNPNIPKGYYDLGQGKKIEMPGGGTVLNPIEYDQQGRPKAFDVEHPYNFMLENDKMQGLQIPGVDLDRELQYDENPKKFDDAPVYRDPEKFKQFLRPVPSDSTTTFTPPIVQYGGMGDHLNVQPMVMNEGGMSCHTCNKKELSMNPKDIPFKKRAGFIEFLQQTGTQVSMEQMHQEAMQQAMMKVGGQKNAAFNGLTAGTGFLAQGGMEIPPQRKMFDPFDEGTDPEQQPIPFDFSPYDMSSGKDYRNNYRKSPTWLSRVFPNTASSSAYAVQNPKDLDPKRWNAATTVSGPTNQQYGPFNKDEPTLLGGKKVNKFDFEIHTPDYVGGFKPGAPNINPMTPPITDLSLPEIGAFNNNSEVGQWQKERRKTMNPWDAQNYGPERDYTKPIDVGKTDKITAGRQNWKDRWWVDWVNPALDTASSIADTIAGRKKEKWLRQQHSADNMYAMDQTNDLGDFNPLTGMFRQNANQFATSRYGGPTYQVGGEYEMDEQEIAQFLANGGEIEYLD